MFDVVEEFVTGAEPALNIRRFAILTNLAMASMEIK
jgi:hypothetical protein